MSGNAKKQTASNLPVPAVLTKVCAVCGQEKPISKFHNHKGTQCNSCHRMSPDRQESVRFASQIKPAIEAFEAKMRDFISHRRGTDYQVPHLMELYAEMTHTIGGARAWAEMWYRQLQQAMLRNPGSKTVLDALKWYAELSQAALTMRDTAPDVANLSDKDLRTAVLAELFVEMPQFFEALRLERPDIAMDLVEAGYDPETGTVKQGDSRFDEDSAALDVTVADVFDDDEEAEETEFTTYPGGGGICPS